MKEFKGIRRVLWDKYCALPRFSFLLNRSGGVGRWENKSGGWNDTHEVSQLIESAQDEINEQCDKLAEQAKEIERLRSIISDCAKSCGATVSVECSLDFMAHLPVEIAVVISNLREERDSQQRVCIAALAELEQVKKATVKESFTVQPAAYAVFAANGNVICFSTDEKHESLLALHLSGYEVKSLYIAPPAIPATQVLVERELPSIVTEALMGMIAAVTSTTPPPNEPPPPFIQAAIDRAVARIRAIHSSKGGDQNG
ncbi:hypothetical protein AX279_19550 [Pseudomonas sp. J237]|nr:MULTISPECIES: hypothetical protein [Pseudomonas]OEO24031.1 hypothetical protein AX279_19550 [Pseudomonas sp. J237]